MGCHTSGITQVCRGRVTPVGMGPSLCSLPGIWHSLPCNRSAHSGSLGWCRFGCLDTSVSFPLAMTRFREDSCVPSLLRQSFADFWGNTASFPVTAAHRSLSHTVPGAPTLRPPTPSLTGSVLPEVLVGSVPRASKAGAPESLPGTTFPSGDRTKNI